MIFSIYRPKNERASIDIVKIVICIIFLDCMISIDANFTL